MEMNRSVPANGYDDRPFIEEPESDPITRTVKLPKAGLPRLRAEVAKLNKRAGKIDVEPVSLSVLREWLETMTHPYAGLDGFASEVVYVEVELSGRSPVLPGGWIFVGAIDHAEAGNLTHGEDPVMKSFRKAAPDCAHCGMKRKRNKTVIVRSESGEVVQVGSTCLKDFLGYHGNPERIVGWMDEFGSIGEDDDDDRERGSFRRYGEPVDAFLTVVAATVRTHGWAARSQSYVTPTADMVSMLVYGYSLKSDDPMREKLEAVKIEDRDKIEAKRLAEFARSIPEDTDNDYLNNVRVSLSGSFVEPKHFGIAASVVVACQKEEERAERAREREAARDAERASALASVWVGEVGERQEFARVLVTFVREVASDYGDKFLVSMTDEDGNQLRTFSSGSFGYGATKGDEYRIKATVKSHDLYQDQKQTMLSRVAIIEDLTFIES